MKKPPEGGLLKMKKAAEKRPYGLVLVALFGVV
jgi:hypothetical protein